MAWMDDLWHEVVGDAAASLDWLKQVVFGEFDDHQSTSALVAQLLASFVPGVVIVMSARDMTAVLIRMVRHPERRESVTEWMILVACAIGLVPALVGAVAGAAAAGVGAIVGGLAGDEAGAALRATALLLIEDGARMLEKLVEFLRRFVKGDILRFLRAVKFAEYADPVAKELSKFIGHLNGIIEKVIAKASSFKWIGRVGDLIEKLRALENGFRELDRMAARQVKAVMAEFDKRLARALGTKMVQADHVVHPNHPAPHPTPKPPTPKRVAARADHPLGKPPGLEPADPLPPKTPPDKNLHPQGVENEPSAAKKAVTPSPAEQAAGWQGKGAYPGVDNWSNTTLHKGDIVVGATPGEGSFLAHPSAFESTDGSAEAYYDKLQIAPNTSNPNYPPYRSGVKYYEVQQDTEVGTAVTQANPTWGAGGGQQYYITDPSSTLKEIKTVPFTKH